LCLPLLEGTPLEAHAIEEIELLPGASARLDHLGQGLAVLCLETEDQVLPAADLVEPHRVVLDRGGVGAHPATEFLDVVISRLEDLRGIRLTRIDADQLIQDSAQFSEPSKHRI